VSDQASDSAKVVASWLTIAAMAALGLSVDIRSVRRVGPRVFVAAAGSLAAIVVLAVTLIRVIGVR
jgi:uncharacterized membrane protein YadS